MNQNLGGKITSSERYLDLIDGAYNVTDDPDSYEDLVETAVNYFFKPDGPDNIAKDVPRFAQKDERLEAHISRLSRLLENELSESHRKVDETFHARLKISRQNFSVTGNRAAEQLTGQDFPCSVDDLPFDKATIDLLKFVSGKREKDNRDKIILATVEEPEIRSCLALIQRPPDDDMDVEIAISYIDWSADLLAQLGRAFGLSDGETSVLSGFLNGQSQKDIARERGRSLETIKAQAKGILRKTECARMSDVVQLSASIGYLLRHYPTAEPNVNGKEDWIVPTANMQFLLRRGGRKLAFYEHGDGDHTVLFIHGYLQGPFFTPGLRKAFDRANLTVLAPSRPGYGFTSPSASRVDFNQTVIDDCVDLIAQRDIKKLIICAHQGGVSHAFRIANAIGDKCAAMVMVGAGIPIDELNHLPHMDRQTRVAAAASKHAPSVFKLLIQMGIQVYKKRGVQAFYKMFFEPTPIDLDLLKDPDFKEAQSYGGMHIAQQGAEIWVRDGNAAMENWLSDYEAMSRPQYWIHGRHCQVMGAEFVKAFVESRTEAVVDIREDAGLNILYQKPQAVVDLIARAIVESAPI